MKSKLNIVIRDSTHPCNPYSSTRHTFLVAVFNCDLSLATVKPLTGVGPAGGNIYGEIEVPAGSYVIVGFSSCKNVWTNWTMVTAGCGQDVCVNLLPRRFEQCAQEMQGAIVAALIAALAGQSYSFSSPLQEVKGDMKKALEQAQGALQNLSKYLPKYEFPVSVQDLKKAEAPEDLMKLWRELQGGKE